ncbi:phosphoinositide 3-kinase adapter protein 1 [Leuresthes tenuis]|uniref:phosphoinositide 3-kinase adapter protein 1 n=1 Tax=Leuresthes tenuis TaxID=355514 RepID=UPI003B50117D
MEEPISNTESANSESLPTYELLILHTAEAEEWATYLQQVLESFRKFHGTSILPYVVSSADQLREYDFEVFQSCRCIVLLLSGVFMDILCDHELQGALQRLLYPPHRVVAFLCGVSEDDIMADIFTDWPSWRKLYAEDEPTVYLSTILELITDSRGAEAELESEAAAVAVPLHMIPDSSAENPTSHEKEEVVLEEEKDSVLRDEEPVTTKSPESGEMSPPTHLTCRTVQPNRVLCGEHETLFIIFGTKVDDYSVAEVEFSSENVAAKRMPVTVENEYTISVAAPDMPAGLISLTLYTDRSCVSLRPVTYYTSMGEVSRYLEEAADPVNFISQAFNFTLNATESLDTLLTDSFKSRMPATGLQLFGVKQIEEDNMTAYQRNEELPTLLHFAARYGLKKLTTILLNCPGSLQAYSVMNKNGDYPNTLAEKSGFIELRHFMDEYVQTADMLNSHLEDANSGADVYEAMSVASQDIMMKYSGCSEDIYESMVEINPECADSLYEMMTAVDENPEEAMLRKFFQVKPHATKDQVNNLHSENEEEERHEQNNFDQTEDELEDPYNLNMEDIYDTVDLNSTYSPAIINRPPAPIPRPEHELEPDKPATYISRVFSDRGTSQSKTMETGYPAVRPVNEPPTSTYDPYAGMKTPGQRQLICLQERVKVGEITVDEAVQEFKAWQFDNERRSCSLRYQQENLKKLRDSITRRHKQREKSGKELDYEISAPMQRNLFWGSNVTLECSVYEPAARMMPRPPPPAQTIQRGSWKTGSTSSSCSTESNRLSTHSTFSCSSGTEPEFEDAVENLPIPPRPPRPSDAAALIPPPRIPPRIPERVPEMLHERYISYPTRALPQRPLCRPPDSAPPVPRRMR